MRIWIWRGTLRGDASNVDLGIGFFNEPWVVSCINGAIRTRGTWESGLLSTLLP
jgi:hypothetical protein